MHFVLTPFVLGHKEKSGEAKKPQTNGNRQRSAAHVTPILAHGFGLSILDLAIIQEQQHIFDLLGLLEAPQQ